MKNNISDIVAEEIHVGDVFTFSGFASPYMFVGRSGTNRDLFKFYPVDSGRVPKYLAQDRIVEFKLHRIKDLILTKNSQCIYGNGCPACHINAMNEAAKDKDSELVKIKPGDTLIFENNLDTTWVIMKNGGDWVSACSDKGSEKFFDCSKLEDTVFMYNGKMTEASANRAKERLQDKKTSYYSWSFGDIIQMKSMKAKVIGMNARGLPVLTILSEAANDRAGIFLEEKEIVSVNGVPYIPKKQKTISDAIAETEKIEEE